MVHLIKPQQIKVTTDKGECHITLDVNITLDHQGIIQQVGVESKKATMIEKDKDVKEEDFKWEMPDFEVSTEKIDFGKEE